MEFSFKERYNYWYYSFRFTFDKEHGFGIEYGVQGQQESRRTFFEDASLVASSLEGDETVDSIKHMYGLADNSWRRSSAAEEKFIKDVFAKGVCKFSLDKEKRIQAKISLGKQTFGIRIEKERNRYTHWLHAVCSCKKDNCSHAKAAGIFAKNRLSALMHAYVVSTQPVNKSLFLDPALTSLIKGQREKELNAGLITSLRSICRSLKEADSVDYYWRFHDFILNLNPEYGDYDAHYLEKQRDYLLLALFDDPGYQTNILGEGSYADPGDGYEDRQHRSNRACFKRVLKEYKKVIKELDVKGDYGQDTYKELLLKVRGDAAGLLHYYAVGKEAIDTFDLPFLELIAQLCFEDRAAAATGSAQAEQTAASGTNRNQQAAPLVLDMADIQAAAGKLDIFYPDKEAMRVFHRLVSLLPGDRKVELYSGLREITLPMEELQKLSLEDQRKLINSTLLTLDNFRYIMDTILADAGAPEKGRFLLRTVDRLRNSNDVPLKRNIADEAARLPDSRLLLAYILMRLKLKGKWEPQKRTPEKELTDYFTSEYEIIDQGDSFYTVYRINDPESGQHVLSVREEGRSLSWYQPRGLEELFEPAQVREVCLEGRGDEYRRAVEKNQDAVDARLFEKKNRKFAGEYRKFCESLSEEKLLFSEAGKAGIEWQIYREDNSSALALRVGHSRLYVVKDIPEFLRSFKTGATTEYGKDLILTHDLGNFREDDAAVLKVLLAAKTTKGRRSDRNNKRYISVSDSLLGNLFEMLPGRTILYNDVPCLLRMASEKVRLQISAGYVLSTDMDEKKQEFLNLAGRGYLMTMRADGKEMRIDQVEASPEETGLIDLVCRNPGTCVKPILGDFRKNIYARFFEMIDVDKGVERELSLGRVRLNTYFDFERSIITARTAAVRDGKEFAPESLTERIDQMKVEMLQKYLETLGFENGKMADEGHILNFFKLDFTRLKSLTNVYLSDTLQSKELHSVGKPVIRVAYKNNIVSVFLEKSEYNEADLEQILAGLRRKKKFILLSGDRIIDLDSETARDLGEAVKDFGMNPKDLYQKKKVSMVAAIKAFSHERCCRVDKYLRDMIEEIRSFKESDIALPKLNADLHDYQAEGFRWLSILAHYGMGGILADDMGLGKTIQIIALIKSDRSRRPSLVVCPKSLVFNWISEFARFDEATPVVPVYGPDSRRTEIIDAIDYGKKTVYITSYDSLRNDIGKYTGEFNYGILDEAQYIKNVRALKTKSVKEIKARHRFALTGTPIENSVVDLWSIFDYIMPGYFDELSRFMTSDPGAIARKSAPFILRRIKADVLEDLPPRYERILSADMTDEQRKLYEAMREQARRQLEAGGKAFDILPFLTRLRQICVDPGMFAENYRGGSGKLAMLEELIPEYLQEGHRILIFSQFVKALESVRSLLDKLGIPAYFLSGATSAQDRIDMMDSFNNGSGIDIFLISLKAGGTGLNLIGADTVIHLDPWWNVAAENQASDRTHRIGQTRNVEVIRLIAADTIEQRVVELQEIKKEVIRQVISDDDGSVTSARLEDIAFVLD